MDVAHKYLLGLALSITAVLHSISMYAQCTERMQSGHQVLTTLKGCVPLRVEIKNLYKFSTADALFRVDWGDGTITEYLGNEDPVDGGIGDPIYTPDFVHEYQLNSVNCGHVITITAVNACTQANDARIELNVSIWDTDQQGLALAPSLMRVCQGFAAQVEFQDVSDWNCFPRQFDQNDPPRFISWAYLGGTIQVPGIVPGTISDPEAVNTPGNHSDIITVPAQDPANPGQPFAVGSHYDVMLNNWNRCNPLNQGRDPVTTDGRIEIVQSPVPDFVSRRDDANGVISTEFCIGDQIYFQNRTANIPGANFAFEWEFFDGPDITDPLLRSSTNRHPTISYNRGGFKLIRLRVRDRNAIGDCYGEYQAIVSIAPTSVAQINVVPTAFCKEAGNNVLMESVFTDVSTGVNAQTSYKWFFYDENGNLSRTEPAGADYSNVRLGPFTEQYTRSGVYEVRLHTRDNQSGCFSEDIKRVIVYDNPVADFHFTEACEGDSILLMDQSTLSQINTNQLNRWEWDFSYDGQTFAADLSFQDQHPDSLKHFLPAGQHEIALRVWEDQNQCHHLISKNIQIHPAPLASFGLDPSEGCSPLPVVLQNTVHVLQTEDIHRYIWEFALSGTVRDSIVQTLQANQDLPSLSHTFNNSTSSMQTWQVRLKSESQFGCQQISSWEEVKVLPVIKPGFNTTGYNPFDENCAPLMVHFRIDDATISKMPERFTWQISDTQGTISNEITAGDQHDYAYVFEALGNNIKRYQVNLSVDIPNACTQDSSLLVAVNPNAEIYIRMDTVMAGCDEFVFDIEAFPKGLSNYVWEISENGNLYTLKDNKDQFRHSVQRNAAGSTSNEFSVQLETSNFAGCLSSTTIGAIYIPSQADFNADFTADPLEQSIPNRRVNIRPDQFVPSLRYHWDFGDGNYSLSAMPGSHTYQTDGAFDIRLKVSEDHCEKESVQRVVIHPVPPQIDFSFTPGSGCAPLTIQFSNLSKYADASTYRWYFGNNQGTSNAENPSYTYHEPGIYSVRLEATNSSGQVVFEEKEAIIEVFANPFASFNVRPLTVKLPNDPVYTTNQSRGAVDYIWDFGDGSMYQVYEPVHHYQDTGRYDITLIAISSEGCMDTLRIPQAVHAAMGNMVRIPNAFIPSLDGPGGGFIRGGEMNSVFYPISEGVVARRMQIFNRWGELLFESDDMSLGWDGYYKGKLCPQDVYVYKVYFKYMDGKEENRVGDVTLLR